MTGGGRVALGGIPGRVELIGDWSAAGQVTVQGVEVAKYMKKLGDRWRQRQFRLKILCRSLKT